MMNYSWGKVKGSGGWTTENTPEKTEKHRPEDLAQRVLDLEIQN